MSPFLVTISLLATLQAATAAVDPTTEFLEPHNQARAEVGVPPLTWSPKLAGTAVQLAKYQRIKYRCEFANLTGQEKYGANQIWASGSTLTPRAAVGNWVAEKKFYDHARNTCDPEHPRCLVYTQVVWRNTTDLGCAQAVCGKESSFLTICLYYPPGNVIGESPY